ncbi:hypothetical protein [Planctomicrobium sp. SH664]|uniref:FHA domain-containing protein n=1 Tax=Planctomicrobium sp. SH664 TaxID=3448125 RepID=UPI003F5B372C
MHPTSPSATGFSLIIERGQTRFPERPVDRDRFLIGAGSNCQLQLGGEMPILHSIIIPQGDHLWIDAVVASPELRVNGANVREAELRSGDLVEIGSFVFSIAARQQAAAQPAAESTPLPLQTAEQLVDGLAAEMRELEELKAKRQRGLGALLQAAQKTGQGEGPRASSFQQATAMENLLAELKARSEQLDVREAALHEHAAQLEQTQQRLQEQLEAFCEARAKTEESATLRMTA